MYTPIEPTINLVAFLRHGGHYYITGYNGRNKEQETKPIWKYIIYHRDVIKEYMIDTRKWKETRNKTSLKTLR